MTYNTLDWLLALLPLVTLLGLMVLRDWDASRAGLAAWLLTLILAAWRFGAGTSALGYAQIKALILTADVSLIVWGALLLYELVERAGALDVIAQALAGLTGDRLIQTLLLGWVFASFLQGVGGFGVPVAITAPLLVGLGVPDVRAAVIPALGHGWAVTFGSLAAAFVMLANASGLPGSTLAPASALLLGGLCYVSGLMSAHALAGWRGVRRALPYVAVTGTAMAATQAALAVSGLWTISAIGAGLAGLLVSVLWMRRTPRHSALRDSALPAPPPAPDDRPRPTARLAFAGYTILIALALGLRGIAPVKAALGRWALAVDLPASTTARGWQTAAEHGAGFGLLAHPGLIILYSAALTYLLYRRAGLYPPHAGRALVRASVQRSGKAAVGVFMAVAVAATMDRAGMMQTLADGLSGAVPGALYAFVAPVIGALGAFVTGSNVNSNAIFGALQLNTARLLGLPVTALLAAQTASAAIVSVLSPAKVAVGCSTVGASEGAVLRRLLGYGALSVLLVGGATWIALVVR